MSPVSKRKDERSPSAGGTIRLLLDHDRNRRLLADRLAGDHTVVETDPDDLLEDAFDVCIVDARAFDRHRDALAAKKRRVEPAFLPYLLLTDRERRDRVPEAVWDAVDEILVTPVAPAELSHRVGNLLERRRLSLDLERRRERSERRFEALFDTVPDPVVVTSADGVVSEANEAFARTVGVPAEDVVGRPIEETGFTPAESVERLLRRGDGGGATPARRSVRLDRDGESRVLELNAGAVSADESASDRIGVFRDVTDREERAEALREQNRRLKEFASTIAHDLRNPLSIARGHLDLARESGDDDHFDAVAEAHGRMEQLIDEILTLARQGQLVTDPGPVSLEAIATRAWENVDTRDAALSVEDDDDLLADEGRLGELFENLFRNAVEHGSTSPDSQTRRDAVEHGSTSSQPAADDAVERGSTSSRSGGDDASVHVRVGPLDADERGFYVEDDGTGIPERDRADVFEAGYTTANDGTGFGLAIVRQIVDGHGWTIAVTEGRAGGARFEVAGLEDA